MEGDNIFSDATEMVTAEEESNHGAVTTELHCALLSGLVTFLVKLTFIKGNNTNLDFHHVSLIIRL